MDMLSGEDHGRKKKFDIHQELKYKTLHQQEGEKYERR
jgi:hypothetical protein